MKSLKNDRGVAIIYVTLFLMVLGLLFLALGIDIGWLAYVRTQGQTAVDASALSAAAALPTYGTGGDTTKVFDMAAAFNSSNNVMNGSSGIDGSTNVEFCTGKSTAPACVPAGSVSDTKKVAGVKVTRTYQAPLFFGKLFNGGSTNNITVSSIAWLGGPGGLSPDLPVALCKAEVGYDPNASGGPTCSSDPPFNAIDFTPSKTDNAGWWNKVGVGQPSDSECKKMVNGTEPVPFLNLTDPIDLNNGQLTSCQKAIEDKFMANNECSAEKCALAPTDPQRLKCTVILPIVDCGASTTGNVPVLAFAAMCITNVVSTPASSAGISGTLNCNVKPPTPPLGGGDSFGIFAGRPVLVK
jgi:Flp pilus assembly protein TadG